MLASEHLVQVSGQFTQAPLSKILLSEHSVQIFTSEMSHELQPEAHLMQIDLVVFRANLSSHSEHFSGALLSQVLHPGLHSTISPPNFTEPSLGVTQLSALVQLLQLSGHNLHSPEFYLKCPVSQVRQTPSSSQ